MFAHALGAHFVFNAISRYIVDRRIHAEMERFLARNNAMVKGLLVQYARIRTRELENEAKVWRLFIENVSNVQTTKPPEYVCLSALPNCALANRAALTQSGSVSCALWIIGMITPPPTRKLGIRSGKMPTVT